MATTTTQRVELSAVLFPFHNSSTHFVLYRECAWNTLEDGCIQVLAPDAKLQAVHLFHNGVRVECSVAPDGQSAVLETPFKDATMGGFEQELVLFGDNITAEHVQFKGTIEQAMPEPAPSSMKDVLEIDTRMQSQVMTAAKITAKLLAGALKHVERVADVITLFTQKTEHKQQTYTLESALQVPVCLSNVLRVLFHTRVERGIIQTKAFDAVYDIRLVTLVPHIQSVTLTVNGLPLCTLHEDGEGAWVCPAFSAVAPLFTRNLQGSLGLDIVISDTLEGIHNLPCHAEFNVYVFGEAFAHALASQPVLATCVGHASALNLSPATGTEHTQYVHLVVNQTVGKALWRRSAIAMGTDTL